MARTSLSSDHRILVLGLPHEEAALAAVLGLRRLVAFGSRVRGDFSDESDLDLLAIVRKIADRETVLRFLHDIEERYDVPFSPVIYTEA